VVLVPGQGDELEGFLHGLGATPEQVRAAAEAGHLHGLAADLVLASGAELTARQVADGAGTTVDDVVDTWRILGLPVDPDERAFSATDVELVRGLVALETFRGHEGDELLRIVGAALGRVADAAVAVYVQTVETSMTEAGASSLEMARDNALTAATALQLGDAMGTLFPHHLRAAIARQRRAQSGLTERVLMRLAIGFVDLVGFTPLAEELPARELLAVITSLEARAFDLAAAHGGRVVKHIGDEIMVVALDPVSGCETVLALMRDMDARGIAPHGGLAFGEVVTRHGDYYGPVVNLASRLSDEAIPGEVLVDAAVAEAVVVDGLEFEPAGRRLLKGFSDPVRVATLVDRR
jgi:adenylate cyclase